MNLQTLLDNKSQRVYISVTLTRDAEIKELNKEHLDRDVTTDVLSFNQDEILEDGTLYLGDIVVNLDQAQRQSKEYKNSSEEEISALVAHGVLHLLGVHHPHDDENNVHGKEVTL